MDERLPQYLHKPVQILWFGSDEFVLVVTTIFVATDRPKLRDGKTYKDESGYTAKETEFHKVTCFNGLATAVANNRNKGDLVAVEGRLHYTRWQDADGNDRYGCEIIADRIDFY